MIRGGVAVPGPLVAEAVNPVGPDLARGHQVAEGAPDQVGPEPRPDAKPDRPGTERWCVGEGLADPMFAALSPEGMGHVSLHSISSP